MNEHSRYPGERQPRYTKLAAALALSLSLSGCVHDADGYDGRIIEAPSPDTQTIPPAPADSSVEEPPIYFEVEPPTETVDCSVKKCIALTFDDGPGPYTEKLLGYLKQNDAKATFFLIGSSVDAYPQAVKDISEQGHQLGNHSWAHDELTRKSSAAVTQDIDKTNEKIHEVTGVYPEVLRPPYGATNESVVRAADMPQILWSVDTEDWRYRDTEYVTRYAIEHAKRGDIILMHGIHKTSVEAVPEIAATLTEEGYTLVTVDELLGGDLDVGRYSQQPATQMK